MKFIVDTHTHTISSGHAYSTVQEMAAGAKLNGMQMIAITDHGPAMKGAPSLLYFGNLKELPEEINGVKILKGVEANIIDYSGKVDIPNGYLRKLDFVIASFHDICITPSTVDKHTNALIAVLENPYIDAVAHPGNAIFQVDIEKVVYAAKQNNKLIEINNHSDTSRAGSEENCKEFALMCKKIGSNIVCGSDAHISFDVGKFNNTYKLMKDVDMPEQLILNTNMDNFTAYLKSRQQRLKMANKKKR